MCSLTSFSLDNAKFHLYSACPAFGIKFCKRKKVFLLFLLSNATNAWKKRVERLGYEVTFDLPRDGDCFYPSAAKALGIETRDLKNVVFDFLKSHYFDASIQFIANSRTTKISLLWQQFVLEILSKIYNNYNIVGI